MIYHYWNWSLWLRRYTGSTGVQAGIRLSAGRHVLSKEAHALAFMAGANAFFTGDKLLTTLNAGMDADAEIMAALGLMAQPAASGGGGP